MTVWFRGRSFPSFISGCLPPGQSLDGFIALIAIIGGVAAPSFNTLLRMWEQEQTKEGEEIPIDSQHERSREAAEHEHQMEMEKRLEKPWGGGDE